jgi:hypothetical protein
MDFCPYLLLVRSNVCTMELPRESQGGRPDLLVLQRDKGEGFIIQHGGEVLEIWILEDNHHPNRGAVSVGFQGHESFVILRTELWERARGGQPG